VRVCRKLFFKQVFYFFSHPPPPPPPPPSSVQRGPGALVSLRPQQNVTVNLTLISVSIFFILHPSVRRVQASTQWTLPLLVYFPRPASPLSPSFCLGSINACTNKIKPQFRFFLAPPLLFLLCRCSPALSQMLNLIRKPRPKVSACVILTSCLRISPFSCSSCPPVLLCLPSCVPR